jgi:hypothetical protein
MRISDYIKPPTPHTTKDPVKDPVVKVEEGLANKHLLDITHESSDFDMLYNTALDEMKISRPELWKKIMRWD